MKVFILISFGALSFHSISHSSDSILKLGRAVSIASRNTAKAEAFRRGLLTDTFSDEDKARVTSCSSKNAGAWLTALPSSEHGWTLSDE